jgi:S-formylglutathione hydrolase FrmB
VGACNGSGNHRGDAAVGDRLAIPPVAARVVADSLWTWIGLTGLACAVMLLGWPGAEWWRRGTAVLAVPLCALCAGLALNQWVGYFPTVQTAWNQLTAGPLPDETSMATVLAMQRSGTIPSHGAVVSVDIPSDASHFKHRSELVYLPPAWFASNPAPRLPIVMMIGGEFNTPADWPRTGNAAKTIDDFARAHRGNAPIFVFVDSGGTFNNDTECVNGSRGNAADHLTKDVVPFVISRFGASSSAANWGIVGWSMGRTCAVDLTVMHPELFSSFVDIADDLAPVAGTKEQTIARRNVNANDNAVGLGGRDAAGNPGDQTLAAQTLCSLGAANGISCAVVSTHGKHDWPFATEAFASSLPWLAGTLGTPGVPRIPLPGNSSGSR